MATTMTQNTQHRLPQAIVMGAPKAGTTTLCAALQRHPGIYMYPKKETHFFNDHYDSRGIDWYADHFRDAPQDALVMEGTPDYGMSDCVDRTIQRMTKHIPDVKLIYMVREPVERVESHYVQMLSNARTIVPIDEALRRWPEIVGTSDYSAMMDVVLRHVPADNIHVVFLDDYIADKDLCHARILRFLGVSDGPEALTAMAAQKKLHTRENQGMDGAFLAFARRSRFYDRINMALPNPVIQLGKRLLRRKLDVPSRLPEDKRRKLHAEFAPKWHSFQAKYRSNAQMAQSDYSPASASAGQ